MRLAHPDLWARICRTGRPASLRTDGLDPLFTAHGTALHWPDTSPPVAALGRDMAAGASRTLPCGAVSCRRGVWNIDQSVFTADTFGCSSAIGIDPDFGPLPPSGAGRRCPAQWRRPPVDHLVCGVALPSDRGETGRANRRRPRWWRAPVLDRSKCPVHSVGAGISDCPLTAPCGGVGPVPDIRHPALVRLAQGLSTSRASRR